MENFFAILQSSALSPEGPLIVSSAGILVLLAEIFFQGNDNSLSTLRKTTVTWKADCLSFLLYFTNFTTVLVRLFGIFVVQAAWYKLGIAPLIAPGSTELENAARAFAGLVLIDFMGYWAHRFDHEVFDWAWITHRLHHSITELNIFGGWRFHPLNSLSWYVTMMVPYFLFFGAYRSTMLIIFLSELRRAWGHSRLNTDFGPIGFLIVSPLFHRRHHDVHDSKCNYGGFFTCWDRMFGTYRAPNESTINAPTGISPDSTYESRGILWNLWDDTVDFFLYFARLPLRAWRALTGGFRAS